MAARAREEINNKESWGEMRAREKWINTPFIWTNVVWKNETTALLYSRAPPFFHLSLWHVSLYVPRALWLMAANRAFSRYFRCANTHLVRRNKKLLSAQTAPSGACELSSPINWWFVSINFQFMRNLALWFDGGENLRAALFVIEWCD